MPVRKWPGKIGDMVYRRAADVITTDLERELVLLDPRNGEMFALNATARRIWLCLPADLRQVAAAITMEFNAPAEHAYDDAAALLRHLELAGLVICAD